MLHLKLNHTRGLLKAADFGLFYEALIIKQNSKKLSYFQTIKFALQSWWFILRSNLRALVYILFFRKKAS